MAIAQRTPALDLSVQDARKFVLIDKVEYELRTANDLSAVDLYELNLRLPRVAQISERLERGATDLETPETPETSVTRDEFVQFEDDLDVLTRMVLIAPDDVIEKLGAVNRIQILKVFIELLPQSVLQARATLEKAMGTRSAGTKPFRGSSGSTGATRSRGSRASRPASSTPA